MNTKNILACLTLSSWLAFGAVPGARQETNQMDYETLRTRAEALFAEGSFAAALELFESADASALGEEEARWIRFRTADCRWRSAASSKRADQTELDQAQRVLQEILADVQREEDRDRIWAEAQESLGDFHWLRQGMRNFGSGWQFYSAALSWWAQSSDLELARERYLEIVRNAAQPPWFEARWGYGYYGNTIPREVIQNVLKIANTDIDRARAHYMLGMSFATQGRSAKSQRALEEFAVVMGFGREGEVGEWYDDALFQSGVYHENVGHTVAVDGGSLVWRPNYKAAVELYRRLLKEFKAGETSHRRDAQNRLNGITNANLGVSVDRYFVPGSEVPYRLNWRNVKTVELALYPIDLSRDLVFGERIQGNWIESIPLNLLEAKTEWVYETEDDGLHEPGTAELYLEEKPALGAYVLRARAGGREARALVLVSDMALTVKATGQQVLAWVTDLQTGKPRPEAGLHLWQRYHDGSEYRRREVQATTAADGTHLFELDVKLPNTDYFLSGVDGESQAFVQGNSWSRQYGVQGWKIYAFTDRPAYRPGEQVHWKSTARRAETDGYQTPEGETLAWEIRDPRGNVAAKGEGSLNAFGSMWGDLELTSEMPLGEFTVTFEHVEDGSRSHVGSATLFRLEEYKLPEYEVSVQTQENEDGSARVFVLGDEVQFDIEGEYYFGGPVAGAKVEVFVYQRPLYRHFPKRRDFPWLYEDQQQRNYWGGNGQQILHKTLRTDAFGVAQLSFETSGDGQQDLEYTIEARMVDDSRREIVGNRKVRVTRSEYVVQLSTEHALYKPDRDVPISVRALDANDNPVAAEGTLKVLREHWVEVWTDPQGREVMGSEVDRLIRQGNMPPEGGKGWTRIFAGYEKVTVAETRIATGEEGEATWRFRPKKEGYFRVVWNSKDSRGNDVTAETRVFIADEDTRELGYLPGGIEIVVDKDTFVEGEEAAVMLLADASGRWVLFSVEAGEILHYEVVHLEGTARLLRLPIDASHVPNVWLTATSVSNGKAQRDQKEVIVPPTKNFLDVDVAFAEPTFEPGADGELRVTVQDHEGNPVETELSFGVFDDALSYIQSDYAGDPRQFFYGQRRHLSVNTRGSFDQGVFENLEKKEGGKAGARRRDDEFRDSRQNEAGALGFGRSSAAPAAKAMRMEAEEMMEGDSVSQVAGAGADSGGGAVRVRSDFRSTALWLPDFQTDEDGTASVKVPFPDSTTRWNAKIRAADRGARFGIGEASAQTRLPIIARLQTPRFFQVGDECIVSANVNNNTEGDFEARVTLAVTGLKVLGRLVDGSLVDPEEAITVSVAAGASTRVDWRVEVEEPGTATFELAALAGEIGDAMKRELPVYPHGIEAFIARAGKLEGDELTMTIDLPARAPGSTSFDIQLTPSLAVTMLDALPYLVDYPYGCTEQTLSRFLPSTIVARTLREQGLSPEDAMNRVFGGIEQEFVDKTHSKGKQPLEKLSDMTDKGLARLYDFQHSDGGWGWWKGGESDAYMTAYVVWGLSLGRDAGMDVRAGALEQGARWLSLHVVEYEKRPDMAAWILHALAAYGKPLSGDGDKYVAKAFDGAWKQRNGLNAYTRALLTLAAVGFDRMDEARVLARNLANGVDIDRTPDTSMVQQGGGSSQPYVLATAHWGQQRSWWRWSDGAVESTAFVLRALLAVDPEHELVEPAMNWLVKNRRGAQWSNTRDTAICVLALNDYLKKSGELASKGDYEVLLNGEVVAEWSVLPETVLRAPGIVSLTEDQLRTGPNEITLRRVAGQGGLYFAVHANFFSLEEPIPARGNEVFVRRDYFKLVGRPTLLSGTVFERVPLRDGETIESGTRIEVVLTVETKNDLEYLLFEDLKPAGFEAVGVRSGEAFYARELRLDEARMRFDNSDAAEADRRRKGRDRSGLRPHSGGPGAGYTGRQRWAHQELRDRNVAVFVDALGEGYWEMRYDLRAEVPGRFHALPVKVHAMYVPEIRANGAELRVEVLEAE